jgi:hypothetical protein
MSKYDDKSLELAEICMVLVRSSECTRLFSDYRSNKNFMNLFRINVNDDKSLELIETFTVYIILATLD